MKKHTAESKAAIIKRMMPPNPVSVATLSSETGIPMATLYNWRKQIQASGQAVPATSKHPEDWGSSR